jgi:hypothetical protein
MKTIQRNLDGVAMEGVEFADMRTRFENSLSCMQQTKAEDNPKGIFRLVLEELVFAVGNAQNFVMFYHTLGLIVAHAYVNNNALLLDTTSAKELSGFPVIMCHNEIVKLVPSERGITVRDFCSDFISSVRVIPVATIDDFPCTPRMNHFGHLTHDGMYKFNMVIQLLKPNTLFSKNQDKEKLTITTFEHEGEEKYMAMKTSIRTNVFSLRITPTATFHQYRNIASLAQDVSVEKIHTALVEKTIPFFDKHKQTATLTSGSSSQLRSFSNEASDVFLGIMANEDGVCRIVAFKRVTVASISSDQNSENVMVEFLKLDVSND